MRKPQFNLDLHDDLIVDIFAGAGGVSDGMEASFGRPPDVAINHDEDAVSVHTVNHPQTKHLRADVREVCPLQATAEAADISRYPSRICSRSARWRGTV
jgi:DNA (cytosine-5)-methyltransferase 1